MAYLRLIGIQCNNLPSGQSLSVWPFFLDNYIGSSPVAINDTTEAFFQADAVADFSLRSGLIYLYINNQTILFSNDYIWDTDVVFNGNTEFQFLIDITGNQPNYNLTLRYTLNITLLELFINTVQGIGLKLFLFGRSLFRLVFGSPRRDILNISPRNDVSKDNSSKDSEIK